MRESYIKYQTDRIFKESSLKDATSVTKPVLVSIKVSIVYSGQLKSLSSNLFRSQKNVFVISDNSFGTSIFQCDQIDILFSCSLKIVKYWSKRTNSYARLLTGWICNGMTKRVGVAWFCSSYMLLRIALRSHFSRMVGSSYAIKSVTMWPFSSYELMVWK